MTTPQNRLSALLKPSSIAVLGASANDNSIGGRPIKFLKQYGFKGKIYPVNPKYTTLQGLECYPGIDALPEPADLLIVSIRAEFVPAALEAAVQKGIKAALIISSGFSEAGKEGKALQQRIVEIAEKSNLLISGPNCQGFIDHWDDIPATFTGSLVRGAYRKGPIAFCSQSGAMGYHFYGMAKEMGIGFSYMISSGNEAQLTTSDYIEYVLDDENTQAVAAYLEAINDVPKLRLCANKALENEKPLIVMKAGTSKAGSQAAASHTGSIAGGDNLVEALFKQTGILRVYGTEQLLDCVKAFNMSKRIKGPNVAIVSISGGAGVVMADDCERFGLNVHTFENKTVEKLRSLIPYFGSPNNPVDLTAQVLGDPEKFSDAIRCAANDPGTDAVVIFIGLLEHLKDVLIPPIEKLDKGTDKPIFVTWMACNDQIRSDFAKNGIPLYEHPGKCIYALGQMNRFRLEIEKHQKRSCGQSCPGSGQGPDCPDPSAGLSGKQDEFTSKKILKQFGIPVTTDIVAKSRDEAVAAAERIGFPVVLKVVSADIPHKSDIGAVALNLPSAPEAGKAYETIINNVQKAAAGARIEGIMVSNMVPKGIELLVGLKNDDNYGMVLVVGLGGIFVEVMKDVSSRILPLSRFDIVEMLEELKAYPLLKGARGGTPRDIEALVDVLLKISEMATVLKDRIVELDINPLIVFEKGKGAVAADALAVLR